MEKNSDFKKGKKMCWGNNQNPGSMVTPAACIFMKVVFNYFKYTFYRPATEVFSGQDLDFLNKHGSDSSSVSHLGEQNIAFV